MWDPQKYRIGAILIPVILKSNLLYLLSLALFLEADISGLGIGDSKAICSAHESFFSFCPRPWGRPDVDRKEEVQEELQDESFRRTFVGFTQAACQNTKKYINIRKFLQKNSSITRTCYLYLLFFQFFCETFIKLSYY